MALHPGLPFSRVGGMIDGQAVTACIASGMLVIVEVNNSDEICGIVSAHTSINAAYAAYLPLEMDDDYAIIIPQEAGPVMYYQYLLREELINACAL